MPIPRCGVSPLCHGMHRKFGRIQRRARSVGVCRYRLPPTADVRSRIHSRSRRDHHLVQSVRGQQYTRRQAGRSEPQRRNSTEKKNQRASALDPSAKPRKDWWEEHPQVLLKTEGSGPPHPYRVKTSHGTSYSERKDEATQVLPRCRTLNHRTCAPRDAVVPIAGAVRRRMFRALE